MAAHGGRALVVAALLPFVAAASGPALAAGGTELLVRHNDGSVAARYRLPDGAGVTLRYRNSLYGSVAEERFRVHAGRLRLVELAADERAVLEEYYVTDGASQPAPPDDARQWRASPADAVSLDTLAVAATDLGERTLLVAGHPPLELWRLVDDPSPTVTLELHPPP